jgi:hypothetical protein
LKPLCSSPSAPSFPCLVLPQPVLTSCEGLVRDCMLVNGPYSQLTLLVGRDTALWSVVSPLSFSQTRKTQGSAGENSDFKIRKPQVKV